MGEPLEYDGCNIYNLASLFLDENRKSELQARYKTGEEGYGHFKKYLKELIWKEFSEAREKREIYISNPDLVNDILSDGAKKMQQIATDKMNIVRNAVGLL